MTLPYRHPACPFDTDGDGDCGRPECTYCRPDEESSERVVVGLQSGNRGVVGLRSGTRVRPPRSQASCYLR